MRSVSIGVHAGDERAELGVYVLAHRLPLDGAGDAVAGDARVGVDLAEDERTHDGLVQQRNGHGHVMGGGLNVGDPHEYASRQGMLRDDSGAAREWQTRARLRGRLQEVRDRSRVSHCEPLSAIPLPGGRVGTHSLQFKEPA